MSNQCVSRKFVTESNLLDLLTASAALLRCYNPSAPGNSGNFETNVAFLTDTDTCAKFCFGHNVNGFGIYAISLVSFKCVCQNTDKLLDNPLLCLGEPGYTTQVYKIPASNYFIPLDQSNMQFTC